MLFSEMTPSDMDECAEAIEVARQSYPGMSTEEMRLLIETGAVDASDVFSFGQRVGLHSWYELDQAFESIVAQG